jgi:uncharacterized protein DUF6088
LISGWTKFPAYIILSEVGRRTSDKNKKENVMQSIAKDMLKRIFGHGAGYAFSSKDFLDLGSRNSVDKALSRLVEDNKIRRVTTGIYDYPKEDIELGGRLGPDIHQVAMAIARKNGVRIQPSGALAANLLGLSNQVPAKALYLTNGKSRTIIIDSRTLQFKRIQPREMQPGSDIGILVTQALRYLGRNQVDRKVLDHLRKQLTPSQRRKLFKEARYMEDWLWEKIRRIDPEFSI